MSEERPKKRRPRWYTAYWIVIFTLTIIIGVSIIFFRHSAVTFGILFLVILLLGEYAAYYGRVKPSLRLNRIMYILLGMPIGFVMWYISWILLLSAHLGVQ